MNSISSELKKLSELNTRHEATLKDARQLLQEFKDGRSLGNPSRIILPTEFPDWMDSIQKVINKSNSAAAAFNIRCGLGTLITGNEPRLKEEMKKIGLPTSLQQFQFSQRVMEIISMTQLPEEFMN
jgi:hypothetical protein